MAVYVKRRRIVLLVIACCVLYLIFNLILVLRSTRKSHDKELANLQENMLSPDDTELEDYHYSNDDDYFLSEEDETLRNTDKDQFQLQKPKKTKIRARLHPGFSTKSDKYVRKAFFREDETTPAVEVVIEKPEIYHTDVENPKTGLEEIYFKAFEATHARTSPPLVPYSVLQVKSPAPLRNTRLQTKPELMPKLNLKTNETYSESDVDALELTDFENIATNDGRTSPPIGPDSIIPMPKMAVEKQTIFHSKAQTTQPHHVFITFNRSTISPTIIERYLAQVKFIESSVTESIEITTDQQLSIVEIEKPTKNPALIVDTPGCKIPKLDPWDPTVMHIIQILGPYICPFPPLFMEPAPNGIVKLNVSILEKYYNTTLNETRCWYQPIVRTYLSTNNREDDYYALPVEELKFGEVIEHDQFVSKCFFKNYTHEQYMPLVRLKKEVEQVKSELKSPSPLNVIIVGIDSVSKLNFLRRFFQTKPYFKFQMKAFDMKGYTKVGDNTFPNLIPLLTGHFVDYYWNESIKDTFFFDNVSFLWKEYARYGHRTFFAEDDPYHGAFNFLKRGFLEPPTDYYYRPLALAIEQSDLRKKGYATNSACLNSQIETDIMYDYLVNFIKTMGIRPYFAFCFTSSLTHDFFDAAGFADAPAAKLLNDLDQIGALNSSAFVMFSDHGIRYGEIRETYIGKFEERMPFMYIHFPQWFLDQHPAFKKNLAINQDRLVTLFDVHATLKHLLHINEKTMEKSDELGLSLFNEIPDSRTCADAHIQEHYCPCNNFEKVPVDTLAVYLVSFALIDHINALLANFSDVCETLILEEIKDARLGLPNEIVLKLVDEEDVLINKTRVIGDAPPTLGDYLITLSVKPSGAIFEGTVRYDAKNLIPKVFGVSRINMYGSQSWCIDSPKLKLYCYCKTQQT